MTTRVVRYQGEWTNYVHLGASLCASQSFDGTRIASSATHGQLLVREAKTGDVIVRLNGHWNSVGWIEWSVNDRFIASACADMTARLWNPNNGAELFVLRHNKAVTSVAFDKTGDRLFTSCCDGRITIWDTSTGEKLQEILVGKLPVRVVAPSPTGAYYAAVSDNEKSDTPGTLLLLKDTSIIAQVDIPPSRKYRIRWSPDGRFLALGCRDGIVVFSIIDDKIYDFWKYSMSAPALSVDWNPKGSHLVVGSEDNRAYIVGFQSQDPALEIRIHEDWIWDVEWHPIYDQLITVSSDGTIGVWRTSDRTLIARIGKFSRGVSAAAWSPDAQLIVSSSADGHFCLWDVERRRSIGEFDAHKNWIRAIQFNKEGTCFFTASQDGTIRLWDPSGNPLYRQIDPKINALWAATWTNDGRIAAVSANGYLSIVDMTGRRPPVSYRIDNQWLRGVSWSNDGSFAAVCGMSGRVYVVNTNDFSQRWSLDLKVSCFSCAISPDDHYLAIALADGSVHFYLTKDGTLDFELHGHESQVWSVAFSVDGKIAVSAGADGTIRTWSVTTKRSLRVFRHLTSCISVSFSKRGEILFGSAGAWTLDPIKSASTPGEHSHTLTDTPVAILDGPARRDNLGRSALVEELAFFLHRAALYSKELVASRRLPEGFVVHVGGRWGSGKTSIVNHLVERVRYDIIDTDNAEGYASELRHWDPVYFSAWSAAGLAPAWWSIAMAIRSHLLKRLKIHKRFIFRIKELYLRYKPLFLRPSIIFLISLFFLILYYFDGRSLIYNLLNDPNSTTQTPNNATLFLRNSLALIADLVGIGIPLAGSLFAVFRFNSRMKRSSKWPGSETSKTDLDTEINFSELPRKYYTWLRQQLGQDLLLVIDDLDRCSSEYVEEALSSIHLMASADYRPVMFQTGKSKVPLRNLPALAIIVASERRWLELPAEMRSKMINAGSRTVGKSIGSEFLEKIFVASLDLPRLQSKQCQILIRKYVDNRGTVLNIDQLSQNIDSMTGADLIINSPGVEKIRADIRALDHTDQLQRDQIAMEITTLDPYNRDMMHTELTRRMNEPKYHQYEESRLIEDFAGLMDSTPRGVKRTLVAFWLNRTLIRLLDWDIAPSDEAVMRWTILVLRWPLIADKVTSVENWKQVAMEMLGEEYCDFLKLGEHEEVIRVGMALKA